MDLIRKRKLLIIIGILIIIFVIRIFNNKVLEKDNTSNESNVKGSKDGIVSNSDKKPNVNPGIVEDTKYNELDFKEVSLVDENGMFVFNAEVTNNTDEAIEIEQFGIAFYDKDGNEIITILGYIGGSIPPHESTNISATTTEDLSKAVTKKIVDYDPKKFGIK